MGARGDTPRCRACGAEVRFGLTWFLDEPGRKGKLMPIDVEVYALDDALANVAAHTTDTGTLMVRALRAGEVPLPNEHRRMPHFASCPNYKRPVAPTLGNVLPFQRR